MLCSLKGKNYLFFLKSWDLHITKTNKKLSAGARKRVCGLDLLMQKYKPWQSVPLCIKKEHRQMGKQESTNPISFKEESSLLWLTEARESPYFIKSYF